jgi:hypothetical protein
MKYLIIYNETEIISITPVDGAEILSTQKMIVATLSEAKTMLDSLSVDTSKIDNYVPEPVIEE